MQYIFILVLARWGKPFFTKNNIWSNTLTLFYMFLGLHVHYASVLTNTEFLVITQCRSTNVGSSVAALVTCCSIHVWKHLFSNLKQTKPIVILNIIDYLSSSILYVYRVFKVTIFHFYSQWFTSSYPLLNNFFYLASS